jgi:DNA-binding MarR family transcriptional regulator
MASASVIPLLSSWEEYIIIEPSGDIEGFARWILTRQPQAPIPPPPVATPKSNLDVNAQSTLLIARLHRIIRVLSKPAIKSIGFSKDLEFAVLVHVAILNRPNKKELCRELLIENSTGVEITKRLAKKGFIFEHPDPKDRRSSLLNLTGKGKKTLMQGYEKLTSIHTSFLDALTSEQKKELVSLLTLINNYHTANLNAHPELLD